MIYNLNYDRKNRYKWFWENGSTRFSFRQDEIKASDYAHFKEWFGWQMEEQDYPDGLTSTVDGDGWRKFTLNAAGKIKYPFFTPVSEDVDWSGLHVPLTNEEWESFFLVF